jgi:hypothetical protein
MVCQLYLISLMREGRDEWWELLQSGKCGYLLPRSDGSSFIPFRGSKTAIGPFDWSMASSPKHGKLPGPGSSLDHPPMTNLPNLAILDLEYKDLRQGANVVFSSNTYNLTRSFAGKVRKDTAPLNCQAVRKSFLHRYLYR